MEFKPAKHLYKLGLLGLIPLFGGILGFVFMLLGLFKYKDKKLTIIGLIAFLFTVAIYGYLFYNIKYNPETKKGFAKLSQQQLNGLPKQIELYKIQYGQYPDSLEQLRQKDKFIDISDPLLGLKMDNKISTLYIYKKMGDQYTIFSVGEDGIPNTSDDLYPVISADDNLKYGLVNQR